MKYNNSFFAGKFEDYLEYLNTVKDKFPAPLFDFVSSVERHDLGAKSLHDSWVDEIVVNEKRKKSLSKTWQSQIEIKILLLGSYHDRHFELRFINVCYYQLEKKIVCPIDLITYEIYLEKINDEDILVFYAQFADESTFLIKSAQIQINEVIL
jgi:hypothetical protein